MSNSEESRPSYPVSASHPRLLKTNYWHEELAEIERPGMDVVEMKYRTFFTPIVVLPESKSVDGAYAEINIEAVNQNVLNDQEIDEGDFFDVALLQPWEEETYVFEGAINPTSEMTEDLREAHKLYPFDLKELYSEGALFMGRLPEHMDRGRYHLVVTDNQLDIGPKFRVDEAVDTAVHDVGNVFEQAATDIKYADMADRLLRLDPEDLGSE